MAFPPWLSVFDTAAVVVVQACVVAVLTAVAINFLRSREAGEVANRQRSPVATGTMLLFFLAYYQVVHRHIGQFAVSSVRLHVGVTTLGLVLLVLGAVVNLLGRLRLGGNWADQVTVYSEQNLVTRGVYGIVRHPLYASLVWMFYGGSLVYHNWLAALMTTVIFLPAMVYRARQEERLLSERFSEYRDYRQQVGMLFPTTRPGESSLVLPARPATVPRNAFVFCRYATAAILWTAYLLRSREIAAAAAVILAASALLTVSRAPLVALYRATIERVWPSDSLVLDVNAMRFAHTVGAAMAASAIVLTFTPLARSGWSLLFWVAVGKTMGAIGFCAVSRIYTCAQGGGTCCALKWRPRDRAAQR